MTQASQKLYFKNVRSQKNYRRTRHSTKVIAAQAAVNR